MTIVTVHPAKIFFSCDWGTTSFRLRRTDGETGEVLSETRDTTGAKALAAQCDPTDAAGRERVFADHFRRQVLLLATPQDHSAGPLHAVISGMASSSVGWFEIPYAATPFPLHGRGIVKHSFEMELGPHWNLHVHLLSGVASRTEMMRGEETELVGLFSGSDHAALARDGWVLLPGSHSKHVRLRDGCIQSWHTFMTGELFEVLSRHSLLRSSVDQDPPASMSGSLDREDDVRDAFLQGVAQAKSQGLSMHLFQVRTRHVLQGCPPRLNRWYLSGLLIGSELGHLTAEPEGAPILLAAPTTLNVAYQLALQTFGLANRVTVAAPAEVAMASVRAHQRLLSAWQTPSP